MASFPSTLRGKRSRFAWLCGSDSKPQSAQASVCCSQLDSAILNIATYPVEHSVGYIVFVFLILPSLDAILHVDRAAALWRAISGVYAHQKIVAYPVIHIRI